MSVSMGSIQPTKKKFDFETLISIMFFLIAAYLSFSYLLPAVKNNYSTPHVEFIGNIGDNMPATK